MTASFGPAGYLAEARTDHTATLLSDGRVLVVGGEGPGDALASAEVWVPGVAVISDADRYITMMNAVAPYDSRPMGDLALNLSMSPDRWDRESMAQGRVAFDDMLARLDAVDVRECFERAHWALRSGTQAVGVGLDLILDGEDEAGKSVIAGGLALAQEGQEAARAAAEPCGYDLPLPE